MKTYSELYEFIISNESQSILPFLEEAWEGKDKQESLFRLFAYLKLIPELQKYSVCDGNFNKGTITENKSRAKLFKQSLKDKGDKSDITFVKDNVIVVTTSKNLNKYGVNDLDLDSITSIHQSKYSSYKLIICIVVRSKRKLLKYTENAEQSSERLVKLIKDTSTLIYDWNDINKMYQQCKIIYEKQSIKDILECDKLPLMLRFHQQLAINNTCDLFDEYNNILWGHIPRSGKSYIMAGLIAQYADEEDNFLIITTAPSESIEQYLTIFNTYYQFNDFNIIHLSGNAKPKISKRNIVICSKQFLQSKGVKNDKVKQIKWLKEMKFTIRFVDESHNGGTTELAQKVFDTYGNEAYTIYITATYMKPLNTYNIPKEAWILWNLEDIKLCKNIKDDESYKKLIEKHGDLITTYSKDNIVTDYSIYPEIHLMTFDFNDKTKSAIIQKYKDSTMGFSTDAIFLLEQDKGKPILKFKDPESVLNLCYTILGKTENDGIFIDESQDSIFYKIKKVATNGGFNSRWFSKDKPLSILAFLPCGITGLPIDMLQETLKNLLIEHNVLPDFEIVYVNSESNKGKTALEIIDDAYSNVKINKKKGLLILSGGMCKLAVSIEHCDIVLMLNNTESMDSYYQMMFRCLTESVNKKCGFVVDLNLQRLTSVIVDYALKITNNKMSIKDSVKYMLEQRLIHFNSHEWMHNYFGITDINLNNITEQLYSIYSSKPCNAIENLLKTLDLKCEIADSDQKLFNQLFYTNSSKKHVKEIIEELTKDSEIKKGIEHIEIPNDTESIASSSDKLPKNINLIDDIMKHLLPLMCILTIHNTGLTSFEEICKYIDDNPETKEIFMMQINIWWSKRVNTLSLFMQIYNKYLHNNESFNNIVIRLKEMFSIAKGNADELSQLIDRYLIPQELEKKQNAEVSTPYSLRQDMLNAMPSEFWTQKHTVFEPCAGKGGFLIDIVHRFKEGLKPLYTDDEELYRIIVEECLYFSDINATNIFICRLLLDPYGKYKLNYNEGDTLRLDIKEKWNLEGFDAVIGNPPYNDASGNKGTGHTLWTKFVEKTLDKWLVTNGYLIYVHPSLWRQYNHKIFKLLSSKQLIYIEIHSEKDGMKMFRCNTRYDWYILQNIPYNKDTIIIDETKKSNKINIKEWSFIPNFNFDLIKTFIAMNNEKCCVIIKDESSYDARPGKKHMSKVKNAEFKYPVVYALHQNGEIIYRWSSVNNRGHYDIIKVIMRVATPIITFISDINGDYAMTQWVFAIVADISEHALIISKMKSDTFQSIIKATSLRNEINIPLLKQFKHSFWNLI